MFCVVGLVSKRVRRGFLRSRIVRRGLVSVETCSASSALCRDVFGEVGLVSVRVRRGRVSVGTCSAKSGFCRDLFGEVGLLSGLVR